MSTQTLKAPFPAFGGKSKVAKTVWERLGDVDNYVEPFCFSAAMLLLRPSEPKVETVNDLNAYVANFWRAVQSDPEAVALHADWPVNETDLHARHRWLVFSEESQASLQRVKDDPEYFDAKVAGWWCWGACCWIGSGWCESRGANCNQRIHLACDRPLLPDTKGELKEKNALSQQLPRVSAGNNNASTIEQRRLWLTDWMCRLTDRLRSVRVCCGHWNRVCNSPSTMTRLGLTGVFLDPPYRKTVNGKKNRHGELYANDKEQDVDGLCDEVLAWCLKWGSNPQARIALCGYEGEYDLPGWDVEEWKASGGYGNQSGEVNENAARERIWFSPACIKPRQERSLF